MLRYTLQQLLKFFLLLFAVSVVAFVLVSVSPIDPVQANVGQTAWLNMSEAKRAQLSEYWGANTPVWQRFINWLGAVVQGDLGISLRYNAPVASIIAQRFATSAVLMTLAWTFSGVIGFVLGIVAALHKDRLLDRCVKAYCFVLASTPTFWLALVFLIVFSVLLGWFPLGFSQPVGVSSSEITLFDTIHHAILPALTLSVIGVANIALHTREKCIDILQSEYLRFARSRGESIVSQIRHHCLRNIALPAITLQLASISEIFGGSVLVEQVFSYPGLGQAAVTAGLGGDVALLVAIAILSAALVFAGNLIANLLYGVIDPRIRRSGFTSFSDSVKQGGANASHDI
ncbi:MAG: ABC transporter permease [Coriobacteriales bacterium]|jgi:peptide/nickel transport system permease protein|nr:ABC transporter permease [Coriobacteriales bacterium]